MASELSYLTLDDFPTYLTHKGAVTQFFEQLVSQFCFDESSHIAKLLAWRLLHWATFVAICLAFDDLMRLKEHFTG